MRSPRKSRGRWRWWGKWSTLTLAAAIALAWLASGWWYADIMWSRGGSGFALWVQSGAIFCTAVRGLPETFENLQCDAGRSYMVVPAPRWIWGFQGAGFPGGVETGIPLWALFLPLAASSAWLWRLDRKPGPGHCPRCHYDLSATPPSAPCPECGRLRAEGDETTRRMTP